MCPHLKDKSSWPYPKDVMHFDDWPIRQSALLFRGMHYKGDYLEFWKNLDGAIEIEEIECNVSVKYRFLWY